MPPQRFAILGSEQLRTATGYIIYIWTDVPCHLWMRWTTIKPQIHKIPVLRRGLYLHADVRICFVVYEDNEQQEEGDTILHTFVKEPWPVCETRWFIFWGTIAGVESPSTSGVFSKHRKALVEPTIKYCYSDLWGGTYYQTRNNAQIAYPFHTCQAYRLGKVVLWLGGVYTHPFPTQMKYLLFRADDEGKPTGLPLSEQIFDTTRGASYEWIKHTFNVPSVDLEADTEYCNVLEHFQYPTWFASPNGQNDRCDSPNPSWNRLRFNDEWEEWHGYAEDPLSYEHYGF